MLTTFPMLLNYSLLAPFLLRVVLGLIILDLGILKFKGEKARFIASFEALHLKPAKELVKLAGILDIVGGIMLIIGLYTQIAALVFAVLLGIELYIEYKDSRILKRNLVFYILVLTIAVSLLFSGAGAFAFDLPL
ncbi:hypothetical protein BH11PAT3_BH11PAT3_3510 [soil metagenome]